MKTPTHVKQQAPPARSKPARSAFTLIELLVVITIIAILASIAVPVFTVVLANASQAKDLSNGKQIVLALRLYAADNYDIFPSYTLQSGQPTTTTVSSSNDALCQLFPNYINQEAVFWLAKSSWCSTNPPPETFDNPTVSPTSLTLAPGENEWAYVIGLNDTSNSAMPLIADAFTNAGSHTYTVNQNEDGGVWKGQKAVVVHIDGSGVIAKVSQSQIGTCPAYGVAGPCGAAQYGDIFTTANANNGWLGTTNVVVNPLTYGNP